MSVKIKIGIVEDELLIAEKIKRALLAVDYDVCEPVSTYDEAIDMIVDELPDLLLLDINLNDTKDGIELAEKVNEQFKLPFVFLTANSDAATLERAKKVRPGAFLVKPFQKEDLHAAIEIAFSNYNAMKATQQNIQKSTVQKDFIFIKEGHRYLKLLFDEMIYIESMENYVVIHARDKKNAIVRSTFSEFLEQLPSDKFCRTHRSYAVQIGAIENIAPTEVSAAGYQVPVSATYKMTLMAMLGI